MPIELTSVALDASQIALYSGLLEDVLWADFDREMKNAGATRSGRVVWKLNATA